jgi:uncharacterized membrane protein YidH (DUF202 family)
MKTEHDYTRDVTEIRSMMQRSTKFLSLTGWSGIMAGIYAVLGAYFANKFISNNSDSENYDSINLLELSGSALNLFLLAVSILILAIGTALFLSYRKTRKINEKLWNPSARRLVISMAIPLVTGGIFIVLLLSNGMFDLIVPSTLIFYGLSLSSASNFTYDEIKFLGIIEIVLGLIALCFNGDGLLFWAIGFGIMHIIFGIYLHLRYDK